ncbi:MAG: flagellar basal-body MS-ring/collar protein FliF [Candidatus Neomarinimicrobiota bacterium]
MNQFFAQLGRLLQGYSLGQRLVLIFSFVGFISAIIALVMWANRPEFEVLYSNLDPTNASKIVTELRNDKIKYQLRDGGATIYVPRENLSELKVRFIEAGYTGDTILGYEIFDQSKIGMTSFMQKLNMRRALEGELMRTINQFPEIRQSRVHLVLPEGKLFEEDAGGSASVVLYMESGAFLKPKQVKGITALVANSVDRIAAEDVVVVDAEGTLLTDSQGKSGVLGNVGSQYDLQSAIEGELQFKVTEILDGIVGPQNSVVKVSVKLNFEQVERTTEAYDPENVSILSEESHREKSSGRDSAEYSKENNITNYELNKTVERYISNTGDVKRLTVAVLVNGRYKTETAADGTETKVYQPRSSRELEQIAALVKSSVGYNTERGDQIEVQNLEFESGQFDTDLAYFSAMNREKLYSDLITRMLVGIGLLIAFFLARRLFQGAANLLPDPSEMPARLNRPQGQPGALNQGGSQQMIQAPADYDVSEDLYIKKLNPEARAKLKAHDKMIKEVVDHAKGNPEDASRLIRSWLTQPVAPKPAPAPQPQQ